MPRAHTFGVLSPFLGGWYFGGILTGIVRAAADVDADIVAIQTLDAGTDQIEVAQHREGWQLPPDPAQMVALDHADGFIVIINAVTADHVRAIQGAGTPVVTVGHRFPDVACPVVLADNRAGVAEAVSHLVEHGHRRIAFAGYLGVDDVRERHAAYRAALQAHGITPDPRLLFEADENQEAAGERVGHALIAAGLPSTALVVGTDANAMGIMRVLTAAGYDLPADQAIIGFDDLQAAAYTTPRLSSVKQSFVALGRTAVSALTRAWRADPGAAGVHHVPTSLVVRESCGCAGDGGAIVVPRVLPAGGRGLETLTEQGIPENLVEIAHRVHELGLRVESGADTADDRQVADRARSTLLALVQTLGRAQFDDCSHLQATLSTQYVVSMELLRGHEEDPRALRWLARTSAAAGCLGLWAGDRGSGGGAPLEVVGTYAHDGGGPLAAGGILDAAAFPPPELLALAEGRADGLVMVVPVRVDASDWGLLAVVDATEAKVGTGREPVNHWAALLAVALDHQLLLRELRAQEERLRVAALYDGLTGLPNRTLFLDRLRQAVKRARRGPDQRFAVLFLDLDGFKVINDSMGHSVGDRLLAQVGERLAAILRASDTAARYGGDEFLILLDGIDDLTTPTMVAERLHATLARPFDLGGGQTVVVSASIGITTSDPRYQDAEELLRDADIAMYAAKTHRKGSHAVFDVGMHVRAVGRLQIETEFREALARDELEVHHQPVVDLAGGHTVGFEALIRWRHPIRGLLAPAEFLPVAEDSGLIVPVGHWVLDESCRRLAAWRRDGAADLWMSVNVSNRQFWHDTFVIDVELALRRHGLDPRHLALEVTEDVVMHNDKQARRILEDLHDLGCRVFIDDFGTGYSSLEALHRLQIDALKIDRSFVSRLGVDRRTSELVRTIIAMCANLGLDVVAEGIETADQRAWLVDLDCTYGQGHLFAPAALLASPVDERA